MYRLDNGKASRWSLSFYSREDSGQIRLLKSVTSTASGPRCTCTSTTVVGSHLGVRIWNFGPKKPSNGVFLTFCGGENVLQANRSLKMKANLVQLLDFSAKSFFHDARR